MKIKTITLSLFIGLLVSCEQEEGDVSMRDYPRLKTLPVSNISSDGAQFNADIFLRGGYEIDNYGFVWDQIVNPTLETSDKVVLKGDLNTDQFSKRIETTLSNNSHYFVRAFVESNGLIVYGENVEFYSQGSAAALVESFIPVKAILEDTITILGRGFSYVRGNNIVTFNSTSAITIHATDTLIQAIVPAGMTQEWSDISVEIAGYTRKAITRFQLLPPRIVNVPLDGVVYCDTLYYTVENFPLNTGVAVYFNDIIYRSHYEGNNQLISVFPPLFEVGPSITTRVEVANFNLIVPEPLTINTPKILSYSDPETDYINYHDTITISYENLAWCDFEVSVEDSVLTQFDQEKNRFKVAIPGEVKELNGIPLKIAIGEEVFVDDIFHRKVEINDVQPDPLVIGESGVVYGIGFSPMLNGNRVRISPTTSFVDGIECTITQFNKSRIAFNVSSALNDFSEEERLNLLIRADGLTAVLEDIKITFE